MHRVGAVRERFTPARWESFRRDMRYFRETMGTQAYLGSMQDHGANATPVWMAMASLLFAPFAASEPALIATGLLDPLLLLVAFVAIGKSFGLRTMLVSMVVFGANDFYMFGTNWAGATLRHDWMAWLALGLCALRTQRFWLGGALLALSAMIRAFPALALCGVILPLFGWLWARWQAAGRLPSLAELAHQARPTGRILGGAVLTALALWLGSSLMLGFDAWGTWLHKVALLHRDPHVNHVSLRALLGGSDGAVTRVLVERAPLLVLAITAFVTLAVIAARGKRPEQAAVIGVMLVPIVFHPANYYAHLVFVVPLVALERSGADEHALEPWGSGIWLVMLGACAAQYFTVLEPSLGLHFHMASAILVATIGVVLLLASAPAWPGWVAGEPALASRGGEPEPAGAVPEPHAASPPEAALQPAAAHSWGATGEAGEGDLQPVGRLG
jgi:hypothetical protein